MRRGLAVVGLGMAAAPHGRSLVDLADRVEVRWAMSPTEARRAAFAAAFPFPTCGTLEPILDDPGVEAALVLTPPSTHLEIAGRLAAAGKHVLLEKPVEVSTARAEALVAACETAGVTLGVVLQHRFRPAAEELAARLAAGALGRLAGASATIRLWRPQSYYDTPGRGSMARDGGGVLMTQAIHTLDLLLSLGGPVAEARAFAGTSPLHRMETEDLVAAALRFENGALGTVDATTAAYPGAPERIELIGTEGRATLTGPALDIAWLDGRRERLEPAPTAGGWGADPMDFPHEWHRSLIADFLDALDDGRAPRVSGREALKVHRLIDAILAAASG